LIVTVLIAPVAVYAAGGTFTDDDTSIFEADIEWLADSGVTAGCNPPANDHFCPNDFVTRGQMAAFIHRLAVNQVVDADAVDGLDAGDVPGQARVYSEVIEVPADFDVADPVVLAEITFTAPAAGRVVVRFDGYGVVDTGDRLVLAATNDSDWHTSSGSTAIFGTQDERGTFSHTRVYDVAAGVHSFQAVGQNWVETAGNGHAVVYGTLTVEYFPTP